MSDPDTEMTGLGTEVVPVVLDNGVTVHVEAVSLGGRRKVATLGPQRFRELTDAIEGIGGALSESLKRMKPKKASVEFGMEVGLESGKLTALICKGSGKANLKVVLEWGE